MSDAEFELMKAIQEQNIRQGVIAMNTATRTMIENDLNHDEMRTPYEKVNHCYGSFTMTIDDSLDDLEFVITNA